MTSIGLSRGTGQGFGSGWISGMLSMLAGALGYGAVLCLLFPTFSRRPDARPLYPIAVVLEPFLTLPRFHHWHHAAHAEAVDRNFALHLPVIDRVFGTAYLPPDRWPEHYGIAGNPVPEGYWRQLVTPFRRS